jgi:ribosomal protein S18 acetylase RimI-like enzyme
MPLSLRMARTADLPSIVQIQAACYAPSLIESPAALAAKLARSPATCWVAEESSQTKGYLLTFPYHCGQIPTLNQDSPTIAAEPDCLYLHDLAVHPSARGLGMGSALVQQGFAIATERNLETLCLVAVQGAAAYWTTWGFQPAPLPPTEHTRLNAYGPGAQYMSVTIP